MHRGGGNRWPVSASDLVAFMIPDASGIPFPRGTREANRVSRRGGKSVPMMMHRHGGMHPHPSKSAKGFTRWNSHYSNRSISALDIQGKKK